MVSLRATSAFRTVAPESPATDCLSAAFGDSQLCCHLQPIVTRAGYIAGFEALSRLQMPNGNLIPPGEFLPILEEHGQMPALDHTMVLFACDFLSQIRKTSPHTFVSVNLSPQTLANGQTPRRLTQALNLFHLHPSSLKLEILEGSPLPRQAKRASILPEPNEQIMIRTLQSLGFPVCFDDFGTGSTDSRRLKGFNAFPWGRSSSTPGLKVDKSLLPEILDNKAPDLTEALEFMSGLRTPFSVVFEGPQKSDLFHIGRYCRDRMDLTQAHLFFQSFDFGRPMPILHALRHIDAQSSTRRYLPAQMYTPVS